MDAASPELVNLVVRSVYMPAQSLSLAVDAQTRVSELKRRLSLEFPSSPSVPSQKLIFGGKICGDDEPLAQILAPVQSSHAKDGDSGDEPVVFHLLVTSPRRRQAVELQTPEPQPAEAQDSPRPSSRTAEAPRSFSAPVPQPQTPFTFGQTPEMSQQQQNLYRQSVLMQQQAMVLQQIQYLQFMLMQQRQEAVPATPQAQNPLQPYGNFYGMMPPQMFQPQMRPTPAAAAAPATQEPVAEPQHPPMLVEMAQQVFPLLDFRMALKMAFMLFIIGQDTPLDRILMLGLLSFISYLHITGIFAKIYQVYSRRRSANGEAAANAPTESDAPEAAAAAGAAIAQRYGMLTRVLRISADRGLVQDVKYFVVGLLLSLVPAWHPQPIQGAAPMHDNAMPDDVPLQGI